MSPDPPSPSNLPPAPEPRWSVAPEPDPDVVESLRRELSLPRALCAVLAVRGYSDGEAAKRFLRPHLPGLADPAVVPGMEEAADRILAAVRDDETILVHGDYDVDGIAGAALLTRWLRRLGGSVAPFVPHRLRDGYDFGPAGVEAARAADADLVVTVDCGIRAHDAVRWAREAGIDVVVTDHHQPGATLPEARAVVAAGRVDGVPGAESLSGTGVAYALCRRLAAEAGVDEGELHPHLDLVALATVADLVPLTGDNRTLTRYGLKALVRTTKPGLRALLEQVGLGEGEVDAGKVGWVLGPRINAAGRVGEARAALRLLLTEDRAEATELAERLEERNRERKDEDRRIRAEALALLGESYDPAEDYGVVLASEGWHPGVIGIVASRVVDRIHRPVVMVALDGEKGRGSARSISGFHLADALEACAGHLERFGGHEKAAGMDLTREALPDFREAFRAEARRRLEGRSLRPTLEVDLELSLAEADDELHRFLRYVGPFGIGNPRPVFAARGVEAAAPREVGTGHLKLTLVQDDRRLEAIGFGLAERIRPGELGGGLLDAAFQLRENVYRGRRTLQARLLDLRPAGTGTSA